MCIHHTGSSGSFFHKFKQEDIWKFETKKYFLHVKAEDPGTGDHVILRGAFRVFGHQEKYFCSLNMINTGTSPIPNGGSLEFISVGNATNFIYGIDGATQSCKLICCDHNSTFIEYSNLSIMRGQTWHDCVNLRIKVPSQYYCTLLQFLTLIYH